jgi:hypothetical protein
VPLPLTHQSAAQFAARFWVRMTSAHAMARAGDAEAAARRDKLVWRIWRWIQDGDLTSDQVRLSFNAHFGRSLNTTQWNNLVTTRLVPMKDRHLAALAEADL